MKYTIEGFNQAKAVELGLCVADLIILRWFVDFAGTDKMLKGKDEYIKVITEKSSSLDEQVTAAQMALVELYEMMI